MELCEKIRVLRKGPVFECAASEKAGEAVLYIGNAESQVYSSLDQSAVGRYDDPEPEVIATRTIDSILEEARVATLDFVSIDVEGHEIQALRGFTLSRWKPHVVIVEDNGDMASTEVDMFMKEAGYYRFWRTGSNDWYTSKRDRWSLFVRSALAGGSFSWRDLLKTYLPRAFTRKLLLSKRALLSRF